jgi:hypothetical protein
LKEIVSTVINTADSPPKGKRQAKRNKQSSIERTLKDLEQRESAISSHTKSSLAVSVVKTDPSSSVKTTPASAFKADDPKHKPPVGKQDEKEYVQAIFTLDFDQKDQLLPPFKVKQTNQPTRNKPEPIASA